MAKSWHLETYPWFNQSSPHSNLTSLLRENMQADEYDGCFLGVSPSLAVVTNVEWEHVDMYPDEVVPLILPLCIPSCISTINCLIFLAFVYTLLMIRSFYFSVGIKPSASKFCCVHIGWILTLSKSLSVSLSYPNFLMAQDFAVWVFRSMWLLCILKPSQFLCSSGGMHSLYGQVSL